MQLIFLSTGIVPGLTRDEQSVVHSDDLPKLVSLPFEWSVDEMRNFCVVDNTILFEGKDNGMTALCVSLTKKVLLVGLTEAGASMGPAFCTQIPSYARLSSVASPKTPITSRLSLCVPIKALVTSRALLEERLSQHKSVIGPTLQY